MTLHELLDTRYDEELLRRMLAGGADPAAPWGEFGETPLHVAARRRRLGAVEILIGHGAPLDARNAFGKTAWTHAVRRGFTEIAAALVAHGAREELNDADRLAVALSLKDADAARKILDEAPASARTGNPEEDRLLADVAGRDDAWPVELLIDAGADLVAPGLDDGTPLHQAAWFGQPRNARILVEAGAPVDVFDAVHRYSPLGWAAHGSGFSGGADQRDEAYLEITRLLLSAGSRLDYPFAWRGDSYLESMIKDASPGVAALLREQM